MENRCVLPADIPRCSACATMTTSADTGAVRDVSQLKS